MVFVMGFASPHVRPMRVLSACEEATEIDLAATRAALNGS